SQEAEGVDLPPDNVINPRHLATSSLRDGTASAPTHTFSGISEAETGQVTTGDTARSARAP
ncbi:MAG: hypothetical protein K0R13_3152, partial [Propionibacteriaceae bacterium]|nr:hypothetical protein [Propionibacteriaceae bacterium]